MTLTKTLAAVGLIAAASAAEAQSLPTVEDRLAVADAIAGMNLAIDQVDNDAYLAFYVDEPFFDSGFGEPLRSREAIRAFLEEGQAKGFITGKRHAMSNLRMTEADGTITATYYLTVIEREEPPAVVSTAVVTDEFREVDGTWKVARHVTEVDPGFFVALEDENRE